MTNPDRAKLSTFSPELRRETMIEWARITTAEALQMLPERVDLDRRVPDPRQLFAVIHPPARSEFGLALYDGDIPSFTTVRAAGEHLARTLAPVPMPAAPMGRLYEGGAWAWGPVERRFGPPLERPAVFILSGPRTGSTLLRVMLAGHPNLFAPPELYLLPFESMKRRRLICEKLGYGWMLRGLTSAIAELDDLSPLQAEAKVEDFERRGAPVAEVYNNLQERAGPRILVDKTPPYAMHPAWLGYAEQAFRNPFYIHLVRHPAAAIESFVRMRFHHLFGRHWPIWDENAWLYGEKCWAGANLQIMNFLRQVDPARQMKVCYEQLVSDPATVAAGVCKFLDIPFDTAVLSPYSGRRGTRDYGGAIAAIGDPNFLSHSAIDPALARRGIERGALPPLGHVTRQIASLLNYADPEPSM